MVKKIYKLVGLICSILLIVELFLFSSPKISAQEVTEFPSPTETTPHLFDNQMISESSSSEELSNSENTTDSSKEKGDTKSEIMNNNTDSSTNSEVTVSDSSDDSSETVPSLEGDVLSQYADYSIVEELDEGEQIFSFIGSDTIFVQQNEEVTFDFKTMKKTNTFRLSLPEGIMIQNKKDFLSLEIVDEDPENMKSYLVKYHENKQEFSLQLKFTNNGKQQITIEDELGELSADFLFVMVGNESTRQIMDETQLRNSVSVATAAQFVTAWNDTSATQIQAAPTANRTLSAAQVNRLSDLNRHLTILRNTPNFNFSPANASANTLNIGSSGTLVLDGSGNNTREQMTAPITLFDISGTGNLEILGGVYGASNIAVTNLTIRRGGSTSRIRLSALNLNLTSSVVVPSYDTADFWLELASGSDVSNININTPYLYVLGSNAAIRERAWFDLKATVSDNTIISSNHLGFNSSTFPSITSFSIYTDWLVYDDLEPIPDGYSLEIQASPQEGGNPSAGSTNLKPEEGSTIYANTNDGYSFLRWEIISGNGSILEDETSPETNFTMGSEDAVVRAVYEEEDRDLEPVNPVDPLSPEVEVNPENKPELPEDQGQLSIDFISSFDFGSQAISVHDQTYYAKPQRLLNEDGRVDESEERPNYVQISDRRSENERNGWTLAVTQKEQFKGTENQVLNGARLSLSNQQVITAQGGTAPGLQSVPCTLVPGNRRTLLHAQGSEGTGTWIYRFGDRNTAGDSIALDVPKGANPEATVYSSTLIWELSAVPDN